ncbi:MAG: alpha-L-fucosidase [Chloroflexota bacterium]
MTQTYQPTWNSLRQHPNPQWLQDVKFGIYTHWGIYSVPATGPNVTWYPYNMYREGTEQYEYHCKTYGHPSEFGYKDFIPMFTAEHFDADEWAEVFKKSGAQFAGPVAEHHDGFPMWDSKYTEWNAAKMGPKVDVVAKMAEAIRKQGMRFMAALHHAENWWFFPHWRKDFDTSDPAYAGLYGPPHDTNWPDEPPDLEDGQKQWRDAERPNKAFLDSWLGRTQEIIDNFEPDLLWFDFGIQFVQEHYRREMLAYYYNKANEWGKEVAVTYKWHNLPPGTGIVDLELGRFDKMTYHPWITDTTVDDGQGWAYLKGTEYKTLDTLVHYLIDNVSKNGYMLLNIGPKPDGTLPQEGVDLLEGIGRWMDVNSEAIYGTTSWVTYGEGPTEMPKGGYFMEDKEVKYTAEDIRYTVKDDTIYAICLGWPGQEATLTELKQLYPAEIASVQMLGSDQPLAWSMTDTGLVISAPDQKPCGNAYTFKIIRKNPFDS